jgi:pimeloyl-ACP methyl ester carboxylesterase
LDDVGRVDFAVERILIVILHAYTSSPDRLAAVKAVAQAALSSSSPEFFCPQLPLSLFSMASPTAIACKLVRDIDSLWEAAARDERPFDRILFVGHSIGSLIARKAYVIACGETVDAPFEREVDIHVRSDWAAHVDRIVLLAGMNRGWRATHHLSLLRAPVWWLGSVLGRLIEILTGRSPMIFQVRRGASFITELRIQWLRMRQRARQDVGAPGLSVAVQLLGSIDDQISPADNIDLVAGGDFVYLDVPYSGHSSVIQMQDEAVPPGSTESFGEMRRKVFIPALTLSAEAVRRISTLPDDSDLSSAIDLNVREVIFVVHGIRDGGFWTHKVARAIRNRMENAKTIATETSSYGYFPMLPFLVSRKRREKVEWLMDRYATAIATYPNARRFHFVGHSNGTYCLIEALRLYPCCRFDNVVLAGSVVRKSFPWADYLRQSPTQPAPRRRAGGSVDKVLNFVATGDWVVAVFPKLFQTALPIQQLGSAGHDGFADRSPRLEQIEFVRGSHGAAIAEPIWPAIAEFVASGQRPVLRHDLVSGSRDWRVVFLGKVPWLWWIIIVGIFCAGAYLIFPRPDQTYAETMARGLFFIVYCGVFIRAVTWL